MLHLKYREIKRKLAAILPPSVYNSLKWLWVHLCWLVFRTIFAVYSCKPIQRNKIVFDNYRWQGYGCNPKYVAEKLLERGADQYDLVWIVSQGDHFREGLPTQFRPVIYGTLRSLREYATAHVWVSNYHKVSYVRRGLRKRAGQYFIQMWHGSLGIKKIEKSVSMLTRDKKWIKEASTSSKMVDYWISNSDFETNVYKSDFWGVRDESILLYGHPRNDIFFDQAAQRRARRRVEERYALAGKRILLYAPTYREGVGPDGFEIVFQMDCYALDYARLLSHLRQRFGGEWVALVRLHPRILELGVTLPPREGSVIDATAYPDIQELLAASDCLVTDYSSCAFDFMLTRRPVFLFATDVDQYEAERGFYYPLETTPFPLAHDNAELMKNVDEFRAEEYEARIDAFLRDKGCIEDGHASERVADLIERLIGDRRKEGVSP